MLRSTYRVRAGKLHHQVAPDLPGQTHTDTSVNVSWEYQVIGRAL